MNEKAIDAAAKADCCPDCDCIATASYCAILHDREHIERILAAALPHLTPPLRAREEIARHLQILDDLFHGLAREYRGYLPDNERGFGTADSRTREMRVEDDTKKFRAAHDAILSRTAGQEWRDISSAPKDEQRILGTDGVSRFVMFWRGANHLPHQDKPGWNLSGGVQRLFPTHWMPLPAPPVAEPLPAGVDREPEYLKQRREHPDE